MRAPISHPVRKRSVRLAGHRTSVSIEEPFWTELAVIAKARGLSLDRLIAEIDRERAGNLSSAIRLYVLAALKARAETASDDNSERM
jgi:predicted DNA-binding ribbon-helix-helix protein